MPQSLSRRNTAYLLLLLNAALWGFSPPIIKNSLNFVSPTVFLFLRYVVATLLFLPIFISTQKNHQHKTSPWLLIFLALLGTPLTLYPLFEGLKLTSSIEGSLIESTSPVFTILGGLIFLHEVVKPKEWLGLIIAILGTLLLTIEPVITGNHAVFTSFTGNLLIISSNLIWAAFLLISKKTHTDPARLTFYSFLLGIPFFFLLALAQGQNIVPDPRALPGILYMAVFGSIVAFWAYQEAQKRIEASEAAVFTYLKPIFTLPLSLFWLKETVSPVTLLAALIILSGVYISERR